jgi:hypothetical protein
MRTYPPILAAAAAVLLAGGAESQDKLNPPAESAKRVKGLEQERIATLKGVVATGARLAQSGRADVPRVTEDRLALLRAELEAAEKDADRVPLYAKAAESLREYEALAVAQHQAGCGTEYATLKVRAKR